jgi:hypothetical protein
MNHHQALRRLPAHRAKLRLQTAAHRPDIDAELTMGQPGRLEGDVNLPNQVLNDQTPILGIETNEVQVPGLGQPVMKKRGAMS